jgi:hypothetical protein
MPTTDPDAPDQRPPDPGCWDVPTAVWPRVNSGHLRLVAGHADLALPASARATIDAHRLAVLRQDDHVDPLDGHALLCRLKVAVALMALDARTAIDETDWTLAGQVMDVSAATREQCRRALTEQSRNQNTARALAAAERDEIAAERKAQRAREAILRKLSADQQLTTGELRRSLKVDIRDDYYDAALAELLDSGQITVSLDSGETRRYPCTSGTPVQKRPRPRPATRVPLVHGYPRRHLTRLLRI